MQGGCSTCPRKLKDFVPPTLRKSKLIAVGEAPGVTEVQEQEGFTGKSGQTIRAAFRDVGILPEEISWSNTIHCRPPENRDPSDKEISCCMSQHVMDEVKDYPLIVLVGNIAANAFFPGEGSKVRGNLAYHPDFPNSRFFTMLHPAAIGYDSKRKDEFYGQVARLGRINRGETEAPFRVVSGTEFREKWARFLEVSTFLIFDLETSSLTPWIVSDRIKSLSVCSFQNDQEVFSLDESDPYWNEALRLLATWLQNPEHQVLGQNIGFDLVWMEAKLNFKCNLGKIHDLQGLYYQLKGDRFTSLKEVVARELDGYRHLVAWPHLEKNPTRLKLYNSEDVHYPKLLFMRDFPRLRPKTRDLMVRVLGPSSLATARMRHAGMHFRSEAWEGLNTEFEQARDREIAAWEAASPDFHRRSYITDKGFRDLDHYIYEIRKYPVLKLTEKDEKPATDDATIKELVRQGALELNHCLAIKNIDKRRSTYIKAYPKLVQPDRRIHSSYHNTTTSTGRLSSTEPNMQNNPRPEPQWKNQIRWLFGAGPGNVLLFGDFSQIELRIAMCLARDPVGMQVYLSGGDIHMTTALSMKERGAAGEIKELRDKAKPVNFSLVYGGSPRGVQEYAANEYGIILTDAEARDWVGAFFSTYASLPIWHQTEIANLRNGKGYMESAVGHVWYYSDWNSEDDAVRSHAERSAINMTCQGPASYFMTYLIILVQQELWKRGIKAHGLGFAEVVQMVHDSLAIEVAENQVEEAIQVVNECLSIVYQWISSWFVVPLVLDLKVGTVWEGPENKKLPPVSSKLLAAA